MGTPKMTGFLIGIVLIGFFAGVFGLYITELSSSYNVQDMSNNVSTFNKLEEMRANVESYQAATKVGQGTPQFTDIVGAFFSKGYTALVLTANSIDIFNSMLNEAMKQMGLGIIGDYLNLTIALIVLILIVVGIIVAAIVKRDS